MRDGAGPPGWLERTFLYTFGLSGLILLIHSGSLWVQGPRVFLVSPPRPWFGRPPRPTLAPTRTPRPEGGLDMEEHSRVMESRVARMRRVCRKEEDEISSPKRVGSEHTLMWDTKHHLIYCPIYKVASGTWTTNFLRLSSFNSDLPKWQRFSKMHNASESTARKMFPPPKGKKQQRKELASSTKFIVVRHPFDRIVSAYKGKISNPMAKPRFYRKLQKEIKADYSHDKAAIKAGEPPTFSEYWRYLTALTEGLVTPADWRRVDCVQSFYSVCVPCDVKYDMILKLETHDADTEFLIRRKQLTELQEPFTMWKHKSSGENQLGDYDYYLYDDPRRNALPQLSKLGKAPAKKEPDQSNMASPAPASPPPASPAPASPASALDDDKGSYKKSLFGQLTRAQVQRLYRNYKTDFDMFGYDIEEFLGYAQDGDREEEYEEFEGEEVEEENSEEEEDEEDDDDKAEDVDEETFK